MASGTKRAGTGVYLLLAVAIAIAAAALIVSLTTDRGSSKQQRAAANPIDIPALARETEPSVVAVFNKTPNGADEGSGVILSKDGLIVTNNHVVANSTALHVALPSGERVPAKIRGTDPLTDVALIQIPRHDLPTLSFADKLPEVGQQVIAIGNPLGFKGSVTSGIVSGLHRSIPSGGRTPSLVDLIQTDAPISPGNSGGALIDGAGNVVGINVAYIPPTARAVAIGFAIPAPLVSEVISELEKSGHAEHAFLGLSLSELSPQIAQRFGIGAQRGAIVVGVVHGGPAGSAGVRPGDVIVGIDGAGVGSVEDVYARLRHLAPGDSTTLTVLRGDKRIQMKVKLAERPQ